MDGDSPDIEKLVAISQKNNCLLVIDEAHALGFFGKNGCGLIQESGFKMRFLPEL